MARGKAGAPAITERQMQVLRLAVTGMTNQAIACRLGISVTTVNQHMTFAKSRLGLSSRIELILHAIREGWVKVDGIGPACDKDGRKV
jgi:DNA-binding NarL/FixJ family response regulator